MPRYYVSLTWDDWPEGGSYGTVVYAADEEAAEAAARIEMAANRVYERAWEYGGSDTTDLEASILEEFATEWRLVDCFDLDMFIRNHTLPALT